MIGGIVRAEPPAYGIVAYNNAVEVPGDYDAVGWVCKTENDGRFQLKIGELKPGKFQLRLRVCHANGAANVFAYDYAVGDDQKPDLSVFRSAFVFPEAMLAFYRGDKDRVRSLVEGLKRRFPADAEIQQEAAHLAVLADPPAPQAIRDLPADRKSVAVSSLQFRTATVGWGQPLRDQVLIEPPRDCFLRVGGRFHPSGLFAHAPSRYELDLDRGWKRFRSSYGLQDGHAGSVVFVIRADGRELFRSRLINDHTLRSVAVDVKGVERLTLSVEDGGDGARNDWAVWIEPRLERNTDSR